MGKATEAAEVLEIREVRPPEPWPGLGLHKVGGVSGPQGHTVGREFAKGKKLTGSFFRSLGGGGWCTVGGVADRKPLMNSEKRTDVYYSKERMLKESLVCPTVCSLLNLVWAEHL